MNESEDLRCYRLVSEPRGLLLRFSGSVSWNKEQEQEHKEIGREEEFIKKEKGALETVVG